MYERLSRDDDNAGESNSIVHQKQMLEDYAMKHGFTNLVHFTDDGWSGATFDRPSWNRLVEGVKNGEITACICKDMSRIGRDHLQVGFFTDILFREKEVRFIAINNGIDSDRQETSEFAPFLNIMNEWFAMAQGGAICIGHLVGERKIHAAYLLGKYVMRISILVSLVLSCIWALMGHTLFSWLTDNPEIIRLGTIILFIDVILEVGRAINIYATNALRATGDVNYPFYVGFVVQWSVAVGCGFLFGIHWGWGLVGMWCAFVLDENLRGIIFVQRWNSLKWTKKGFVK